jgi:hypothetical protein
MASYQDKVLGTYSGSSSGVHLLGTVPSGKIWVLKFGTAINNASGSIEISMFFTRGSTDYTFLDQLAVPLGGVATFKGWQVAEAGDKLQIYVGAAHLVRAWFSGVEITP